MPEHTRRHPHARGRIGAGLALVAAVAATLLAAAPASASQGSVPTEVAAYAADPDGLVSRLDDLFGVGSGGAGIDFNDTTEVGQLNRIFTFTEAFVAGVATDTPVERQNLWTAPITVNDDAIGVAIIWINPASVAPELADFSRDPDLARSVSDVPADAYLVHDDGRAAWFTLVADELTPLVPGDSGLTGPVPLADYQLSMIDRTPAPVDSGAPSAGLVTSLVVIAAAIVGVVIILLVPQLVARRSRRGAAGDAETEAEPQPEPDPEPAPEPEPAPSALKKPRAPRTPAAASDASAGPTAADAPAPRKPRAPRPPATPPAS